MNADLLLQHFDRLSEAPDAVPRLRRFILDLAVRGKLVEQDPNDEPASELLKRILVGTGKAGKTGKNRGLNIDIELVSREIWPIPATWSFIPLEEIVGEKGVFTDGDWVESKDQDPNGGVRLIQLADVGLGEYRDRSSRFMNMETAQRLNCTFLNPNDILIARMPDPLGRACIFPGEKKPSVTVVDVAVLRLGSNDLDARYIVHTINSTLFRRNVEAKAAGTTRSRISRGNLGQLPFPLPPLTEQHRIVAKVDELMALCDQLETAKTEREQSRDRFLAANLHNLNQPAEDEESFHEHVEFTLNHLPRITTRPAHIKQLRQIILNLAVRGKLVTQDKNDESAIELMKRIETEKSRLFKDGKIPKPKISAIISDEEKPFSIPSGWVWTRVWDVAQLITSGSRDWAKYYSTTGAIFVTMGNLSKGHYKLKTDFFRYVNPPTDGEGSRTKLKVNDLLISITGDVGNLGLITSDLGDAYINQHTCLLRFMPEVQNRYFPELLRSPWMKLQFDAPQRGIKNSFRLGDVGEMLIPVPPLAEQYRIVAKVDELMELCDQLETQLNTAEMDNRRLLEAVLHESLAPALE